MYEAAHGADAILILTEWDEFRSIDWARLKQIVKRPLLIDGRNLFRPSEVASRGFTYVSTGRLSATPKPELIQQESFGEKVSQKVLLVQ
jgi:UDPglucose 6-dehydrogenase